MTSYQLFDFERLVQAMVCAARHADNAGVISVSHCPMTDTIPSIHVRNLADLRQVASDITTSRHSEMSTKAEAMVDGVRVFTILLDELNRDISGERR